MSILGELSDYEKEIVDIYTTFKQQNMEVTPSHVLLELAKRKKLMPVHMTKDIEDLMNGLKEKGALSELQPPGSE